MARVKVTSTDINARLARGECANYRNNSCQGRTPCAVVNGESCVYFANYVRPLLELQEFSNKYAREAKVAVALNPQAKVIRKRRLASAPALTFDASSTPPAKTAAPAPTKAVKPQVTAPRAKEQAPAVASKTNTPPPVPSPAPKVKTPTPAPIPKAKMPAPSPTPSPKVIEPARARTKPQTKELPRPVAAPASMPAQTASDQMQLLLEITPSMPVKRRAGRR